MKKVLSLIVALTLLLGLCACGETNPGNDGTKPDTTKPGKQEDVTITIGIPTNALVDDYDTNAFTEWLEEKTGYNLEFVTFMANEADYKSQLSTYTITGEKLPDILIGFWLGDEVYKDYGEQGYFQDVSKLLLDKEKSATFWNSFEKLDKTYQQNILNRITEPDGSIYVVPHIEETEFDIIDSPVVINKKWLDALNLEMPTDRNSLYNVLKAFKERDPNGNGKQDEVPLIGYNTATGNNLADWILNMFLYHDSVLVLNQDESGKLYAPQITDEYREALIWMNGLVKEGLLSTATWTATYKDLRAMVNPVEGVDQTVGIWIGHPTLIMEPEHPGAGDWAAIPMWGNAVINENGNYRTCFITEDCENLDAAWNLLMTMYSEEGAIRMRYGEEGTDWVYAEGGKSYLGYDAEIKVINDVFTQKGNECWKIVDATILRNAENETVLVSDDMSDWAKTKMALMKDIHNIAWERHETDDHTKYARPLIFLSHEDEDEIEEIRANCVGFMENCLATFVCGSGAFNNPGSNQQWNGYLTELNKMGLQDWIDVMQRTMDGE